MTTLFRWLERAAILMAVILSGCAQQQKAYPKPTAVGTIEEGYDCAQLEDAILKTDAVRWAMRQDGVRLISPGKELAAVLIAPLIFEVADEGHAALHRMDLRLLSLLALKKDKNCSPAPSGYRDMTDLDLYELVAELVAKEKKREEGERLAAIRAQRMELLDRLRPE